MIRQFAALIALVLGAAVAWAQPEGNAHPKTQMVSSERAANPFGDAGAPLGGSKTSVDQKRSLAAAVDLEPLRDLAVFHNGRVKILDTLARESVRAITGRKDYFDVGPKGEKLSYDPMFTLIDLMSDPGYYGDKPLLAINYLPLRREFLERSFPSDGRKQELWMKLTRITPRMYAEHSRQIGEKFLFEDPWREAMARLDQSVALWQNSPANMEMVAPSGKDQPWSHLSALADDHPVRRAFASLGDAWRSGDAATVNEQVRAIAAGLPKINAEVYPQGRRTLEHTYNRLNAFEWGSMAYFLTLVSLLLAFGTGRRWLLGLGVGMLMASIALHGVGFVLRCMIAERFAIQNQFESMTGLSLFGALLGLGLGVFKRQWIFGAAAAGLGFLVLLTATQTAIPGVNIEREAAILNTSVLLKYHVTTVLVSYGLITLGFILSLFYLGVHYFGSDRAVTDVERVSAAALGGEGDGLIGKPRVLWELDRAQMTVLQLAFWTLAVGILLGAWWADHSWGRFWAFDPKETWALITWIVYLIVIHMRFVSTGNRGLVTSWLSVAGFFVMLWTYFGVNLLLAGLHAYA